ncbi:MAG: ABC transporter substrate-binding protein [Chloroflexota bacterium]
MRHRNALTATIAVLTVGALAGVTGSALAQDAGSPSPAAPVCDATQIGLVTRCENFYTDFWPVIQQHMEELHQEALAANGGTIVIWDWYEIDPGTIERFTSQFPGLTIKTQGLQYNLEPSIIAAQATGAETTDFLGAPLTLGATLYDEGYYAPIDWAALGVPAEYLQFGQPGQTPDSINGWLLQYNTDKAATVPTSLDAFTAPEWKDQIAVAPYQGQFFSGYGMKHGEEAMTKLIGDLRSSGNMLLTSDAGSMLSSGDRGVVFDAQNYNPNPAISVSPFEDSGVWFQYSGVNTYGANHAGATLWALWNSYDPDWITARLTDPDLANTSVPFPGLPSETIDQATGLMKQNLDAWTTALQNDWAVFETRENRDEYIKMIQAADAAMQ